MLGVTSDAGVIFEEEFRRQLKHTSWRIFTVLIPALLLIAAVVAPIVTELPGRTKSGFGLLITAATGLFLPWLSARVFRAALLLYGQRMGLRSVWKALREAN